MPSASIQLARPWVIVGYGRLGHLIEQIAIESAISLDFILSSTANPSHPTETSTPSRAKIISSVDEDFPPFPEHAVIWLTLPDDLIRSFATQLAPLLPSSSYLLHCSGSLSSRLLRPPPTQDHQSPTYKVASLHPLMSVPFDTSSKTLQKAKNAFWTVEGDHDVVRYISQVVAPLGIVPKEILPEQKPLYHAAAVSACGLLTATFDLAVSLASAAGFSYQESVAMLRPLVESTVSQWDGNHPLREKLTGPVARGDIGVLRRHFQAFDATGVDKATIALYRALSLRLAQGEVERYLSENEEDSPKKNDD